MDGLAGAGNRDRRTLHECQAFDEIPVLGALMTDHAGSLTALLQVRHQRVGEVPVGPSDDLEAVDGFEVERDAL